MRSQGTASGQFRIIKNLLPKHKRKAPASLEDNIGFGKVQTDHMLVCDFLPSKGGWQTPEIVPYGPFSFSPDSVLFHYGQMIFEGMKAYRNPDNPAQVYLFRPDQNAQRFYNSAVRLSMEPVPTELFQLGIEELLSVEGQWVLPPPGSLYIRPTLIPLDTGVSYRSSQSFRFFVIMSPSKNYYSRETSVTVYIEREHVRAVRGGVGSTKCAGNYGAALFPLAKAKAAGAEQVLWLDAFDHAFVEEVGSMNVMFVFKDKIVTPPLSGTILPGITRTSLITLARDLGYTLEEAPIRIDDVLEGARSGELLEAFGCGTAAVVSPIDAFIDGQTTISVNGRKIGGVSLRLKQALLDIQTGRVPDPYGWRVPVDVGG